MAGEHRCGPGDDRHRIYGLLFEEVRDRIPRPRRERRPDLYLESGVIGRTECVGGQRPDLGLCGFLARELVGEQVVGPVVDQQVAAAPVGGVEGVLERRRVEVGRLGFRERRRVGERRKRQPRPRRVGEDRDVCHDTFSGATTLEGFNLACKRSPVNWSKLLTALSVALVAFVAVGALVGLVQAVLGNLAALAVVGLLILVVLGLGTAGTGPTRKLSNPYWG